MHQSGFEPAIPANERPQSHALDRVVIGISNIMNIQRKWKTKHVTLCSMIGFVISDLDSLYCARRKRNEDTD